jgi:hypothetical protein
MLPPDQKEEQEEMDWGEIYSFFVMNTNITRGDIPHMTYPQIKTIMLGAGKWLPLKWGIGGMGGMAGSVDGDAEERTVEGTRDFVSLFKGIDS